MAYNINIKPNEVNLTDLLIKNKKLNKKCPKCNSFDIRTLYVNNLHTCKDCGEQFTWIKPTA